MVILYGVLTGLNKGAFYNCSSLESITVESGNTVYHSAGNCLIETESKTLIAGCKTSVIPTDGSVTSIGSFAFYGCSSLENITIPDTVTSIDSYAFRDCGSLENVYYNGSIDDWAMIEFDRSYSNPLYYAEHLYINGEDYLQKTSIELTTATEIDAYAFYRFSKLESVTIPDSVTRIGYDESYSRWSLTTVYYGGTSEQWWNIIGYTGLDYITCYYYSQNEPELNAEGTAYNGNYWRYVDGVPTAWVKETAVVE